MTQEESRRAGLDAQSDFLSETLTYIADEF